MPHLHHRAFPRIPQASPCGALRAQVPSHLRKWCETRQETLHWAPSLIPNSGESASCMPTIDWVILSLYFVFVVGLVIVLTPRPEKEQLVWYARPVSLATIVVSGTLLLSLIFW
jgi:hypothetical protein